MGVTGRIITVLEGESLLNDATALVLLRTAIAGSAVSLGGALGDFASAIAIAVVIEFVAGHLAPPCAAASPTRPSAP
jgi:CPA1 family monovalent cation:H+ antiporter